MQRHALGIIAILFLAVGLTLFFKPELFTASESWSGIGMRVGVVLAIIWLAYPHLQTLPPGFLPMIVLCSIVLARFRQLFPIVLVIVVAILILRPRRRDQRPKSQ